MAYQRRVDDKVIGKMKTRLSAMQQIDTDQGAAVDYGGTANPLTVASVQKKLDNYTKKLESYNKFLEQADRDNNDLDTMQKDIAADYSNVLSAAKPRFGKNSNEVEMLGGTRSEERKRPVRKAKAV